MYNEGQGLCSRIEFKQVRDLNTFSSGKSEAANRDQSAQCITDIYVLVSSVSNVRSARIFKANLPRGIQFSRPSTICATALKRL